MKREFGTNPSDAGLCKHGNFIISCEFCTDKIVSGKNSEDDESRKVVVNENKDEESLENEKEIKRVKRRGRYDANILPPTEKQVAFAESLGYDGEGVKKASRMEVFRVLGKKYKQEKEKERHQIIKERGFIPGIKVRKSSDGSEYIISSIKEDGWLCFKGVMGGGSNPNEYEAVEDEKSNK